VKVRIFGNHSSIHCGCAAVWKVLTAALKGNGCTITTSRDCDALVINGEGSMHHGRPTFFAKMQEAKAALQEGRDVYLVNTVWDSNPADFDDVLRQLSGVSVREVRSSKDLSEHHNVNASICLDYSYFYPIPSGIFQIPREHEYYTDYLNPEIGTFDHLPLVYRKDRVPLSLNDQDWTGTVSALAGARLLVTGRHHAVYAACKSRTPFAAIEGNSHKISGLVETSGIPIPVARTEQELEDVIAWCRDNKRVFDALFDWMDREAERSTPQWALPRSS
jgi:hypothetical protein